MARWVNQALAPLAVILLLVLLAHGIALHVVGQELASFSSILKPRTEPLFTRRITQQATSTVAPRPQAAPAPARVAVPKAVRTVPLQNTATVPTEATISVAKVSVTDTVGMNTVPENTRTLPSPSPTLALASPEASPASATVSVASVTTATSATSVIVSPATPMTTTFANPVASLAEQGDWPLSTRLNYKLGGYFRGELHGDARVQWSRDDPAKGDNYQVQVNVSVLAQKISMVSQGRVRATGLEPQIFEENNRGKIRNLRLEAQEVITDNGARLPRPAADPFSVQDAASQFVELGHRFKNGRNRLAEGEVVKVWLARPGGMDEWVYDIGPAETIDLPDIGPVQAFHLTPRPLANPRGPIKVEMWFAPSLQYLPVRIKLILNAETHLDLKVQEIIQ
jgi:Protein of unknown function (DUF3108)